MKIDSKTAEELARIHLGGNGREVDAVDTRGWRAESFGAGRFSQTFRVRPRNKAAEERNSPHSKDEYVLRIGPPDEMVQLFYEYRMMRQEPELHRIVQEETGIPIPPILAHDFSRSIIVRDYLFMPRLPGDPLSAAGLSPRAAARAHREWGAYTAQLHGIRAASGLYGYLGAHKPMEARPTWAEAFLEMYRLELADIRRLGIYDDRQVEYAVSLLQDNLEAFEEVKESVLCHGDLWITNLLVEENGEVTGLIDFDRACWGDREWDLAIADYCGVSTSEFFEGYGGDPRLAEGIDARQMELRRSFYLLYEHQKYIVISLSSRRNNPSGARRYAEQSLAMMRRLESG